MTNRDEPDLKSEEEIRASTVGELKTLLFRDWIRQHPEEREIYAAAKRELAQRNWKLLQHYADAKINVVREILARAAHSSATQND
jgi:GrpB-like predicted nucleotidyltransferase (UPF0157 family)